MTKKVAVLATLDTKGSEAEFLRSEIASLGLETVVIDLGVFGEPTIEPDFPRGVVAADGGGSLDELRSERSRDLASQTMSAGATKIVSELIEAKGVDAIIGIGGTQGTSTTTSVMRSLPYGFPKLMVSTVASGDTSAFVGSKDITMMFSVCDILGLNPFMRHVLSNAAAAVCGMASVERAKLRSSGNRVVGLTNLGVLTDGATFAKEYLESNGCEVMVFHAAGAGGNAMEDLMLDGLIHAVFDYAMGDLADDVHLGLRAAGPRRLTTAGRLGLPQVLCPGGVEHVGLFLSEPNKVPSGFENRQNVFHSPVIAAPRLNAAELGEVAEEIAKRLQPTTGKAVMMLPLEGTSRYSIPGGPLHNPQADEALFSQLRAAVPSSVEIVEKQATTEDRGFVREACDRLLLMMG